MWKKIDLIRIEIFKKILGHYFLGQPESGTRRDLSGQHIVRKWDNDKAR